MNRSAVQVPHFLQLKEQVDCVAQWRSHHSTWMSPSGVFCSTILRPAWCWFQRGNHLKRSRHSVWVLLINVMPRGAPTPCRYPGCAQVLSKPGYCTAHQSTVHKDYGRRRRAFDPEVDFYKSTQWRSVRSAFLREHPLCGQCQSKGQLRPAVVVDHRTPIKAGGERFEESNLQSLCIPCHNRKSALERSPGRG